MLSVQKCKWLIRLLVPVFIAMLSFFVLSEKIPQTKFVQSSVDSVENSKDTIMRFASATLATSVAISAMPDDFASPLANTLADMNKYFVFILMVLWVERLILVEGIEISFLALIPIACLLYTLGYFVQKDFLVNIGKKIGVFGIALALVIPCSTHFINYVCADYIEYVEETITDTQTSADSINEILSGEKDNRTIFEKIAGMFETAVQGVKDLLSYFNNMIKKCINSIAIMIVTTFVLPLLNLFFFKWLLGELFKIEFTKANFTQGEHFKINLSKYKKKQHSKRETIEEQ